ncbi:MAG: hypothetical protein M1354_04580 [Candidatus Marsarchaeota archaeon]|nr:hypothetical protein [Candidatus Marsarchaeota archaeon]
MIIRRKFRYLLVEASRDLEINDKKAQASLADGLAGVMGYLEYSEASPRVMAQVSRKAFIIRCARGQESRLLLALAFVKELDGRGTGLCTIRTSGSIRRLVDSARLLYGIPGSRQN